MKIAVVAPGRHPIAEPYGGGLEAFCGTLVTALRQRGHHVDLFAGQGSRGHVTAYELPRVDWTENPNDETDHTYPPGHREREDKAYERLRRHLEASNYDAVHNNALHPELLRSTALPVVTTLHCPPVESMLNAVHLGASRFVAVSHATARSWPLTHIDVVHNAVNADVWRRGPGGDRAIYFGRIVREKGPHLAIDACRRAGVPITLAGRCGDPVYFAEEVAPRLGDDANWIGHLPHSRLADLVGRSRVALMSPTWDEPFGLVAIEAMSTGTPVAAFARGGLAEVLEGSPCPPVAPNDVEALSAAIHRACDVDRASVAAFARGRFGIDRLVDDYLRIYRELSCRTAEEARHVRLLNASGFVS